MSTGFPGKIIILEIIRESRHLAKITAFDENHIFL